MTTQRWKLEALGWLARSGLEGGNPWPLLAADPHPARPHSARGLAHAKTGRTIVASGLFLVALGHAALAQYSIDWSTLDGGGGTSTGGVYAVSGTIGQPDAGGPMTNGQYSVTGGFWSFMAVQTPGAPRLTIQGTTTNAVLVTWPSPSLGYALQQNSDLNTTNWLAVIPAPEDNGTTKTVSITPASGRKFFRLMK